MNIHLPFEPVIIHTNYSPVSSLKGLGYIIYESDQDGQPDIYRLNLTSGTLERLTFNRDSEGLLHASPDGKYLEYIKNDKLIIYNLETNAETKPLQREMEIQTSSVFSQLNFQGWLNNDDVVLHEWNPGLSTFSYLFFVNLNGISNQMKILSPFIESDISPNGTLIAIGCTERPGYICIENIATQEVRTYPFDSLTIMSWHPNSTLLAFIPEGNSDIGLLNSELW